MNKKVLAVLVTAAVLLTTAACTNPQPEEPSQTEPLTYTTKPGDTTVKPFVEAQTQVLNTTATTTPDKQSTTQRVTEQLVTSVAARWPSDKLLSKIPKPDSPKIKTSYEYKTVNGKRIIVRFTDFDYTDYLSYIDKVEQAGFSDNNDRYHIPDKAPSGTAMFYYSYDGERSFGIYWYGSNNATSFDCEIVICDYDQARAGEIKQ